MAPCAIFGSIFIARSTCDGSKLPLLHAAPVLDERARAAGILVVAANADRVLDLGVSDEERTAYTSKFAGLTAVHATAEMQKA